MSRVPNLARPRGRVEALMLDQCIITHNPRGKLNATFDPDTLQVTDDSPSTVYEGKCLVKPTAAGFSRFGVRPVLEGVVYTHEALLPWDAGVPMVGDEFTLTATADEALLDSPMQVVAIIDSSTFPVVRKLGLLQPTPALPTD